MYCDLCSQYIPTLIDDFQIYLFFQILKKYDDFYLNSELEKISNEIGKRCTLTLLSLLCTFKFDEQKIALSTFHRNLNKSCNCFYLSWLRAIISANYLSALGWVMWYRGVGM